MLREATEPSFREELYKKVEELGGRPQEVSDPDVLVFYIPEDKVLEIESFLGGNGYALEVSEKSFFGGDDMNKFAEPGKYKYFQTGDGDYMFRVTKKL